MMCSLVLPFCREMGVGVIPWSPIARGWLAKPRSSALDGSSTSTSIRSQADKKSERWFADANPEIIDAVEKVAEERGVSMALVATAWVLRQGCWPILGVSSEARVHEAVQALSIKLTDEECRSLEAGYKPRGIQGM